VHGEIQSNEHPINLDHAVGELLCNVRLPLQRIGEERAEDTLSGPAASWPRMTAWSRASEVAGGGPAATAAVRS
jgi:hypothetical protein